MKPAPAKALIVTAFSIVSWSSGELPETPVSEVHFILDVEQLPLPIVLRLKSAAVTDEVIAALQKHRADVWGSSAGQPE